MTNFTANDTIPLHAPRIDASWPHRGDSGPSGPAMRSVARRAIASAHRRPTPIFPHHRPPQLAATVRVDRSAVDPRSPTSYCLEAHPAGLVDDRVALCGPTDRGSRHHDAAVRSRPMGPGLARAGAGGRRGAGRRGARRIRPAAAGPRRVALRRSLGPDDRKRRLRHDPFPGHATVQEAGGHPLAAGRQRARAIAPRGPRYLGLPDSIPARGDAGGGGLRLGGGGVRAARSGGPGRRGVGRDLHALHRGRHWQDRCGTDWRGDPGHGGPGPALSGEPRRSTRRPDDQGVVLGRRRPLDLYTSGV